MGIFRSLRICDRCGCRVEEKYTSLCMEDIVVKDNDDHECIDRSDFALCDKCAGEVYKLIMDNPLPKFGDE